jgi:hypothetical protein
MFGGESRINAEDAEKRRKAPEFSEWLGISLPTVNQKLLNPRFRKTIANFFPHILLVIRLVSSADH